MREHLIPIAIRPDIEEIIRIDNCGHCKGRDELLSEGRTLHREFIIHYVTHGISKIRVWCQSSFKKQFARIGRQIAES